MMLDKNLLCLINLENREAYGKPFGHKMRDSFFSITFVGKIRSNKYLASYRQDACRNTCRFSLE
jgi:hypothetical protein